MSEQSRKKSIKKKIISCVCFAAVAAGAFAAPAVVMNSTGIVAEAASNTEINLNSLLSNYIASQSGGASFVTPTGVTIEKADYYDYYKIKLEAGDYKLSGDNKVNGAYVDVQFFVESGTVTIDCNNVTIVNDDTSGDESGTQFCSSVGGIQYVCPFKVESSGILKLKGTLCVDTLSYYIKDCDDNSHESGITHSWSAPFILDSSAGEDFFRVEYWDENGNCIDSKYYLISDADGFNFSDNYTITSATYISSSGVQTLPASDFPCHSSSGGKLLILRQNHTDADENDICDNCGSRISSSTTTPSSRPSSNPTSEPRDPLPLIGGKEQSWTSLARDILNMPIGSELTIELNGLTEIPENVISAIKERQIKTTFIASYARRWYVDGADIGEPTDAYLGIITTNGMSEDGLRGIVGTRFTIEDTNIPTSLQIIFKAEHAGLFGNLYKLVDGKPQFVETAKIAEDGTTVFTNITEAGDYIVMLCEYSDLPGDMDNDGIVNLNDSLAAIKHFLGEENGKNPLVSDVNNDGVINANDALEILKIFLSK